MTLEQVQYFVVSAETGSFSAAARQLFVSHSSVSRGVAALEKELGIALLVRSPHTLQCTAAGAAFLTGGRALLEQAAALEAEMARLRENKRLRITSISAYIPKAYALIRRFREVHPEVELDLTQTDQRQVIDSLLSGRTDMGLAFSFSLPEDPSLEALTIEQGRFCALMSASHPLARREYLTREDILIAPDILGQNPFVEPNESGRRPTESLDVQSILLQIKSGSGMTILPEHAAVEFGQGCVQVPIRDDAGCYQLLLSWRKENLSGPLHTAVRFFRGCMEQEAAAASL